MTENQRVNTQGVDPAKTLSNASLNIHKLTVTCTDADYTRVNPAWTEALSLREVIE